MPILRLALIEFWLDSFGLFMTMIDFIILLDILPLLLLISVAYILVPYTIGLQHKQS